jgi:predicted alpha-1,2-mannosidase
MLHNSLFSKCLFLLLICGLGLQAQDLTRYVNPFVGTSGDGHTFPGATIPFGLVQLSPETNNYSWQYSSGYRYEDSAIIGFAHTHLNGTGWMDLGDVLMLPYTGNRVKETYRSRIDKKSEKATAGYYTVNLPDEGIKVELTATHRTGVQRYTFTKGGESHILLDFQSGLVSDADSINTHVLDAKITVENNTVISGYTHTKNWVEKKIFFVIEFSKPFVRSEFLDEDTKRKLIVGYTTQTGEVIEIRVAISSVSIEGARQNLSESKGKSFETVKTEARDAWNTYLSKITIKGSKEQKINFYTSMYHLFIQPNNMADTDGRYTGADDKVHQSANKAYYTTLSIWDTYRAAHPLYTIISPEKDRDMVYSILDHYDAVGMLPIWTLWGKENYTMIGNHAVPIIVDAYFKGLLKQEDTERAYHAIKQSLTKNSWHKYDWSLYDQYGYLPADTVTNEAVSRTLESTTDDWCAAQMAKSLGKEADYQFFSKRANYYKNLYDPSTKLMRPKKMNGEWVSPFDPIEVSPPGYGDYTEGNAWQYTWHVQHDIEGLIELMGGKQPFMLKLDTLFTLDPKVYAKTGPVFDVAGLIGQYAHGNEPSHHVAYLYNYAGAPWKTQEMIPRILKTQYLNKPDGLSGNDDCGQMSAWYILSSLGFYPVNPASGIFDIGAPFFKRAAVKVGDNVLTVQAKKLSNKNKYIQAIKLNGKPYHSYQINYSDIMKGGTLQFIMGKEKRSIK